MCSIHAKEKATQSHDQGLHYHINRSFFDTTKRRPASQQLSPRSAILVGQGGTGQGGTGREREREHARFSFKGLNQASGVASLDQAHFLQEKCPKGIGWGGRRDGSWLPMSSDLAWDNNTGPTYVKFGQMLQSNPVLITSASHWLKHGCGSEWLDLPTELPGSTRYLKMVAKPKSWLRLSFTIPDGIAEGLHLPVCLSGPWSYLPVGQTAADCPTWQIRASRNARAGRTVGEHVGPPSFILQMRK